MIRRRELIAGLVGAVAAWPLVAHAQRQTMPVIGFLNSQSPDMFERYADAFRQGLKTAGYVEGRNVAIEYRWAQGRRDQLPAMAADLARRQVAVIAATGGVASGLAAKTATTTIPIVAISGDDPIKSGLVASLNRPGGNVTVVSFFAAQLIGKRLALLGELIPSAAVLAVLVNPNAPEGRSQLGDAPAAAAALGRQLVVLSAGTADEIETAFATLVRQKAGGLVLAGDPFFLSRRDQIVALAARHAIPTIHLQRDDVAAGGLISYGNNLADAYRRIGIYTGRILKGDKPGDLPVDQATKFEMALNLETAKALGLDMPLSILISVDEVIE